MSEGRRPAVRADIGAWRKLGELLQLRRAELGYRRRPAFTRDRDINIRLVTDIENNYRPNTYLTGTLREIAQAYAVTYDSLTGVLAEQAAELTPTAAPAVPLTTGPGSSIEPPPRAYMTAEEAAAGQADADTIRDRLLAIADKEGIAPGNVTGTRLFGEGTPDAATWDRAAGRFDAWQRIWMIAEIRRRELARGTNGTPDENAI